MKKDYKLFNFILPPFLLIGFTPAFLVLSLVGNFVIDSAVFAVILLIVFKKFDSKLYVRKIFVLWGLGFLADFIGIFYYILIEIDASYEKANSLVLIVLGILIASLAIFLLDYFVVFRRIDMTKKQAVISALAFAVLTAPYTFLLRFSVYIA
ncbi:MAG: hypothetical protein VZR54_06730 [Ruminococcus sp.]|nr:hypothetical protein [Ruminococcus sp.]